MNTATKLAEFLRNNSIFRFPTAQVLPAADPYMEDDAITITEKVHVQVNGGGGGWLACVVQENNDGTMTFHPKRYSKAAILHDLRSLNLTH